MTAPLPRRSPPCTTNGGLDKPLIQKYFSFIGELLTGNLGDPLYFKTSIAGLLAKRIPLTLGLMILAAIIAFAISVPLAMLAATHENGSSDWIVRILNAAAQGMPQFWVGTMLIIYLAANAGLFPVGGYGDSLIEHLWSLILPAMTVFVFGTNTHQESSLVSYRCVG
nr:ABC transporter permease [Bifidobacterium moukalabense]